MKKKVLICLASLSMLLVVTSCKPHEHNYKQEWSTDSSHHWHECECGEKKDYGQHELEFGDILEEPENDRFGFVEMYCKVCDYKTREPYSQPPSQPINFEVTINDRDAILTWEAPLNNGALRITGYSVYCGTEEGSWTDIGNVLTYTYSNLEYDTTYLFNVLAINEAGQGPASESVSKKIELPLEAPSAVTNLQSSYQSHAVTLTWDAPSYDGRSDIIDYEVKYDKQDWQSTKGITTHTFTELTNGTEYEFSVRACNAKFQGEIATIRQIPSTTPSAPTNIYCYTSLGTIRVDWSSPSDSGGALVQDYFVSCVPEGSPDEWVTPLKPTSHAFKGVTNGATYTVGVYCTNKNGASEIVYTSAIPGTTPSSVQNLTATITDSTIVELNWDAPATIAGLPITSYRVATSMETVAPITLQPGTTNYEFVDHVTGDYTFSVSAINALGEGAIATVSVTPNNYLDFFLEKIAKVNSNFVLMGSLGYTNYYENGFIEEEGVSEFILEVNEQYSYLKQVDNGTTYNTNGSFKKLVANRRTDSFIEILDDSHDFDAFSYRVTNNGLFDETWIGPVDWTSKNQNLFGYYFPVLLDVASTDFVYSNGQFDLTKSISKYEDGMLSNHLTSCLIKYNDDSENFDFITSSREYRDNGALKNKRDFTGTISLGTSTLSERPVA